jgi:hypothetical protein
VHRQALAQRDRVLYQTAGVDQFVNTIKVTPLDYLAEVRVVARGAVNRDVGS